MNINQLASEEQAGGHNRWTVGGPIVWTVSFLFQVAASLVFQAHQENWTWFPGLFWCAAVAYMFTFAASERSHVKVSILPSLST